jgi:DNA polymerase-3 subunit beta
MKVVCDREKLRDGLAIVNNVVPSKSPKPVLENVCLVATIDGLEILGTDLDCSVRYRIPIGEAREGDTRDEKVLRGGVVRVDEPGVAVVPARVVLDFVRDLSAQEVVLSSHETTLTIQGGEDRCQLVTVDRDEFPVIASFGDQATVAVQGGAFTRVVQRTSFAAAREAGRYAMHGVLTEYENEMLRLVATDGRRLAMSSIPAERRGPTERARPAIVPTKGMQLFCRVISDPLETVQLHLGDNQIGLKTKNAEIFARLIDGEFPKYAAVIPRETSNHMEADADLLSRKLRLVANVTGVEARAVKLRVEKEELLLTGQSAGRGDARARMECAFKGAAPAEIAFNPDYLLEGLKNCEGEVVKLDFNERTSPGKFMLAEGYVYIVMPITVEA